MQKTLETAGDSIAGHDRARAEILLGDARTALEEQAPIDRLRSLTGELHQLNQALATASRSTTPPPGPSASDGAAGANDDDVIDADFTTG